MKFEGIAAWTRRKKVYIGFKWDSQKEREH
jgi:hypothetical protein